MDRPTPVLIDLRGPRVARSICDLMIAAYSVEAQLLDVTDFPPLRRALAGILAPHSTFAGIYCDGRLVAAIEIEAVSNAGSVIAALVVAPDRFGKGLGETLVRRAIDLFGCPHIDVTTAVANVPARALYAKVGFREVSHWTTGEGLSMVALRREHPAAAATDGLC